jgi:hypothetical protein
MKNNIHTYKLSTADNCNIIEDDEYDDNEDSESSINNINKTGIGYIFTATTGYMSKFNIDLTNNVIFSISIEKNVDEDEKLDGIDINVEQYDEENTDIQIVHCNISVNLTKDKKIVDIGCNILFFGEEYLSCGLSNGDDYENNEFDHIIKDWKSIKMDIELLISAIESQHDNKICIAHEEFFTTIYFSYQSINKMFQILCTQEHGDYDSSVDEYIINIDLNNEINKNNVLKQFKTLYEYL